MFISNLFLSINFFNLSKFSSFDLSSTTVILNLIFGYFFLQKLIELINELKDLKEYSILGSSNNLFLF